MSSKARHTRRFAPRGPLSAVAILLLAVAPFGACSETAAPGGGAACVPGQTYPCGEIDGCAAVRRCLPDLTDFGECQCETDASPPGDAGEDAADGAGDSP